MAKLKIDYSKSKGASKEEMDNVAAWQQKRGLTVDGVWGKNTQATYEKEQSKKKVSKPVATTTTTKSSNTNSVKSFDSITKNQILTPNKVLQQEEQSKKDFNKNLEQARIAVEKTTPKGEMVNPNTPEGKRYLELLKQKPLSKLEAKQIEDIKSSINPTNIALTAATMLGVGASIKYGLKYGKPLLNKVPFGKILKGIKGKFASEATSPVKTNTISATDKLKQYVSELEKKSTINKNIKESILKANPTILKNPPSRALPSAERKLLPAATPETIKANFKRINKTSNEVIPRKFSDATPIPRKTQLLLDAPISPTNLKKLAKSKAIQDMEKEGIEVANKLKLKKVK